MTTTGNKFLLAVNDTPAQDGTKDETIKRLFVKIHRLYVEYMLNPFCELEAPIVSPKFDSKLEQLVEAYNRTVT